MIVSGLCVTSLNNTVSRIDRHDYSGMFSFVEIETNDNKIIARLDMAH